MKANELRIGNYIHSSISSCNYKKGLVEVDLHTFAKIRLQDALSHLEPIPLTEEWLLKFGASERVIAGMDNEFTIQKDEFEIAWDKTYGVIVFTLDGYDSFSLPNIKHVHQYQNLYFALTNEELTIC